AVDPPGTTWRDRPAVRRGDGVFLAGDRTAAPGMLAEVSFNSALEAATLALTSSGIEVAP
ncbi:FAD-dependent oxidoreductase, partial [Streptomyces sp. SID10853]|nr:FAD-dependent oxidoreductase [Streptomyces sp. SID10853]